MANKGQQRKDGKPNFAAGSPTIMMQNLHHLIEIGTYVTFLWEDNICCGQITNVYTSRDNQVVVTVNEYLRQSELEEEL